MDRGQAMNGRKVRAGERRRLFSRVIGGDALCQAVAHREGITIRSGRVGSGGGGNDDELGILVFKPRRTVNQPRAGGDPR
jgi:hypothetical protein